MLSRAQQSNDDLIVMTDFVTAFLFRISLFDHIEREDEPPCPWRSRIQLKLDIAASLEQRDSIRGILLNESRLSRALCQRRQQRFAFR